MRTSLELISELPDRKQLRYCNLKRHNSINKPIVVKIFALCISTAHFPYMNVKGGSIQHEETKFLPEERDAMSLQGSRALRFWQCTESCWW